MTERVVPQDDRGPITSPFLLRAADKLAEECWRAVEEKRVDARSPIGDAVLSYRDIRDDPLYPAPVPQDEERGKDDARHITWDFGRRTLCGKQVTGDPGDFYLPLGKAPRYDEGGAWCWSCLQLQDEARLSATAPEREKVAEFIEAADWLVQCLRGMVHKHPVRGLPEAEGSYILARKALSSPSEPSA